MSFNNKNPTYISYDPSLNTNTTFVQADPSNFRAVVQRLTGSSSSPMRPASDNMAPSKLHERRKLEMIKLKNSNNQYCNGLERLKKGNNDLVSPNSTLDGLHLGLGSPSPGSSTSMSVMNEENERTITAEKGFYLHPISPLNTTTKNCHDEPQLLPLFPLHSPRDY